MRARERDRPTRASKAQMGSLKRRVQSAGKQLEQEQEESVLRLARALGEIDEGEASGYLDARVAQAEREIERLTLERAEFAEAVNSEIGMLKVRMQAALEAVGVGPAPEEQSGMAEEIRDSIVSDVQATLTRAGDHFAKRFEELEERWTKTMVDMTSGVDALLKRMAVLEGELREKVEAGDHTAQFQRTLEALESRLAQVESTPPGPHNGEERLEALAVELSRIQEQTSRPPEGEERLGALTAQVNRLHDQLARIEEDMPAMAEQTRRTSEHQRQIGDVQARLDKIQVAVEVLAQFAGKPVEVEIPSTYLTRMEALERTVGHLVSWSELHSPSVTAVQTSLDSVLNSVSALESRMKTAAQAHQLTDLQTAVGSLSGLPLRMQAIEARLDKTEGPLAAMTSQIYTKLSELVTRLEALEVRAALSTDIIPQRRRR